jgi:hypothetical protein
MVSKKEIFTTNVLFPKTINLAFNSFLLSCPTRGSLKNLGKKRHNEKPM